MQKKVYCGRVVHTTPPSIGLKGGWFDGKPRLLSQTLRIMRMLTFFLFVASMAAAARPAAQTVSLSGKDLSLKQVFSSVKKQTGYLVFANEDLLDATKPVSVAVSKMPLADFLSLVLREQPLSYRIDGNTIFITEKKASPAIAARIAAEPDLFANVFPIRIRVADAANSPLTGASVTNKSTKQSGVADANGIFALVANIGDVIEISFVGFQTQTITIKNQTPFFNIELRPAENKLDEVVISTGYSTKKTGEITGAIQRVSGDELRKGLTTSDPASLLKGRTTGLYISEQNAGDPTSSGGQIFVRGQSSIAGVGIDQFNEFALPALNYGPLIVLDGVIMPNQNLKELVTLQEIQDVTILKDAAATAIYGSRAAAGVLVVTTKKGRAGKPRISAEVKYGINKPNQATLRFLTGPELYAMQKEFYTEDYHQNNASLSAQYPTVEDYLDFKLPEQEAVANSYDWSKFAFVTSHTQEANVSASGGNENTRYYVGGTYYNEQSTGVQNGLIRKTFRLNLDSRLTDRLTVGLSLNGILNNGKRDQDGNVSLLYGIVPWANPYGPDGSLTPALSYKMDGSQTISDNPLFNKMYNSYKLQSQLFFGSAKLEYKITDWLTLSSTNSGNLNYNKSERYLDVRTYSGGMVSYAPHGFLGTQTSNLNNYLTSNQLSFFKKIKSHTFRVLAAMEWGKTTVEDITVNVNHVRAGYPVISLGRQIGDAYDFSIYGIPTTKEGNIEGGRDIKAVFSGFGEVGYTYKDRYSLSASLRTDASSSFGRDKRYGTFYSTGAAWTMSDEQFMKDVKWVSNLKLRASYGTSGSQLGDNFLTKTLYDPRWTYSGEGGALISVLGNPELRWEVTKTFNAGIDLGLFRRVDATIDLYSRRSEDLLQKVTLQPLSGFPAQWKNVASVKNTGLEILINSQNIVNNHFQWNTSFNFSYNKNQILSVADDSLAQGWGSGSYFLFRGDDINTLKAVKYAGVDAQTGKPLFEKLLFDEKGNRTGVEYVNTLAEVDAATDRRQNQTIGTFQPKFYGGLTNTLTYKQFSLNILITYALKYVMVDELAEQNQGTSPTSYNQVAYRKSQVLWTEPGQTNATEPWFYYQATTDYRGSSKYIHDASNASLRSVRVGYDLPGQLMNKLKLSNCTVYLSGDNLYTVYSKYMVASSAEGPSVGEAQDFGGSSFSLGIPRRYIIGLQLTF